MNKGMISGCIVRTEDLSARYGFPAALVTLHGQVERIGAPALEYYEQVRASSSAATLILNLSVGTPILFDNASVEQQTWKDAATQAPRSRLVIRASSASVLNDAPTQMKGDSAMLLGAVNLFTIRGRLACDANVKDIPRKGKVTEGTVIVNLDKPHNLKVQQWHAAGFGSGKRGQEVILNALIKTDVSTIDGEKRYFTYLEAMTASVLA